MSVWWKKERERSELILLAVCLVIWFSLIFRLLSLVVVTDAGSGLTTAIFTSNTSLTLWNIKVWYWHIKQNICMCKSLVQFTKSCNVSAYEMIPHSDIAPERHTMTVPAPNKWPTLHINTHLHAGKIQGGFVVSVPGSHTSRFRCDAAPVQFLES